MSREPDQPDTPSRDYRVGYGQPPKAHRFKPGQSGNPRGRPKGTPTLEELFVREARCLVKLKQGDEVVHISKMEALVRRVFQKALEGDLGAIRLSLQLLGQSSEASAEDNAEPVTMPDDQAVQRILTRFAHLLPGEEGETENGR